MMEALSWRLYLDTMVRNTNSKSLMLNVGIWMAWSTYAFLRESFITWSGGVSSHQVQHSLPVTLSKATFSTVIPFGSFCTFGLLTAASWVYSGHGCTVTALPCVCFPIFVKSLIIIITVWKCDSSICMNHCSNCCLDTVRIGPYTSLSWPYNLFNFCKLCR